MIGLFIIFAWRVDVCNVRVLILDLFSLSDLGDSFERSGRKQELRQLRTELDQMLKQRLAPHTFSGKYLTQSGKLELPANEGMLPHQYIHLNISSINMVKGITVKHSNSKHSFNDFSCIPQTCHLVDLTGG